MFNKVPRSILPGGDYSRAPRWWQIYHHYRIRYFGWLPNIKPKLRPYTESDRVAGEILRKWFGDAKS